MDDLTALLITAGSVLLALGLLPAALRRDPPGPDEPPLWRNER